MLLIKLPVNLLIIGVLIYFLSACEGGPADADKPVNVSFSVECVQRVCTVDIQETLNDSGILDSMLCDMGDGNQVDALSLGPVYDYTYAAPGTYDITCRAENISRSITARDTISVNVVGSEAQDNGGGAQTAGGQSTWGTMMWGSGSWQSAVTE